MLPKACKYCGTMFSTKGLSGQVTHCPKHRGKKATAIRSYHKNNKPVTYRRTCCGCGVNFETTRKILKYHSEACRLHFYNELSKQQRTEASQKRKEYQAEQRRLNKQSLANIKGLHPTAYSMGHVQSASPKQVIRIVQEISQGKAIYTYTR